MGKESWIAEPCDDKCYCGKPGTPGYRYLCADHRQSPENIVAREIEADNSFWTPRIDRWREQGAWPKERKIVTEGGVPYFEQGIPGEAGGPGGHSVPVWGILEIMRTALRQEKPLDIHVLGPAGYVDITREELNTCLDFCARAMGKKELAVMLGEALGWPGTRIR